jgi:HAD superfamily hydrolase (TIGR01509 family)
MFVVRVIESSQRRSPRTVEHELAHRPSCGRVPARHASAVPAPSRSEAVEAVVFDMDGVIICSEELWDAVREQLAREHGGRWSGEDHRRMMGMNTQQWTEFMHHELGVGLAPPRIRDEVVRRLGESYRSALPLLPGAVGAVRELAARWSLGLASSSPKELIELVLRLAGIEECFSVVMSSEQVRRGKPEPDVYLAVLERMGVQPAAAVAVEDSGNGIRAARAARMRVIAVPNPRSPPAEEALDLADLVLPGAGALTPAAVLGACAGR